MTPRKRIGMIIYSNPDYYPPTLNAIKILLEDFDIVLISRNYEPCRFFYPSNVQVYRIGKPCLASQKHRENPIKKIFEHLRFVILCCWYLRRHRCGLVYAYDMHALPAGFLASRLGRKMPLIYHNHDLHEDTPGFSWGNFINWLQIYLSRYAQRVIFPDVHRAEYFKEKARLSFRPFVVMNAPLRITTFPECRLKKCLASKGIGVDYKVVLYQGGIDKWRSIPEVIRSMKFWPDKTVLVLLGQFYQNEEGQAIFKLIEECGYKDRVIYLGFISYTELFSYTCGADLGLAFYKPITPLQELYGGGGSNKIFEYMALGIPAVTTDSRYFREFFKEYLYFTDPYSPEKIGTVIRLALTDEEDRKKKSLGGRQAHLREYNYEKQFYPVLEYIRENIL